MMHPLVGPRVEAERLYVGQSRLASGCAIVTSEPPRTLRLLDVGLGAGSMRSPRGRCPRRSRRTARRLELVSFDRSLAALDLALARARRCLRPRRCGGQRRARVLNDRRADGPRTAWRLRLGELPSTLAASARSADVVFWDPFSPRANPALWTVAAFAALFACAAAGATVYTYSGSTATRIALLLAGFAVGVGDDVGVDKQSTCAAMRVEDLAAPLDRGFVERLRRSSAPFPPDAPADALARIAALPQFAAG